MYDEMQRYNDMTFSSKSAALNWIFDEIPSIQRESIQVIALSHEKGADSKLWGLFRRTKKKLQSGESAQFQRFEDSSCIRESDFTTTNDKVSFRHLIEFLKPRIDAARRGEVSDRTVDDIYDTVKKRRIENIVNL